MQTGARIDRVVFARAGPGRWALKERAMRRIGLDFFAESVRRDVACKSFLESKVESMSAWRVLYWIILCYWSRSHGKTLSLLLVVISAWGGGVVIDEDISTEGNG
jgi:hypothetical protein